MLIEERGYRHDNRVVDELITGLRLGRIHAVAFVVPADATSTLPLYGAAVETARRGWSLGIDDVRYWFVTPEPVPPAGFGARLEPEGITFVGSTFADLRPGTVLLDPQDERLEVDCVVTLADVSRRLASRYSGRVRLPEPAQRPPGARGRWRGRSPAGHGAPSAGLAQHPRG